jgi:hypothetical protein
MPIRIGLKTTTLCLHANAVNKPLVHPAGAPDTIEAAPSEFPAGGVRWQ